MEEQWIPIKDFEDKYEISSLARVRSKKTGLILKPLDTGDDYLYHIFYEKKNKKAKPRRVKIRIHRMVALHFVPNPHFHRDVNHIDGNKHNNMPSNLEWCSKSENLKHAFRLGLIHTNYQDGATKGEKNVNAKLSYDKADEIRRRYAEGNVTLRELAADYAVGIDAISKVVKNVTWIR